MNKLSFKASSTENWMKIDSYVTELVKLIGLVVSEVDE